MIESLVNKLRNKLSYHLGLVKIVSDNTTLKNYDIDILITNECAKNESITTDVLNILSELEKDKIIVFISNKAIGIFDSLDDMNIYVYDNNIDISLITYQTVPYSPTNVNLH